MCAGCSGTLLQEFGKEPKTSESFSFPLLSQERDSLLLLESLMIVHLSPCDRIVLKTGKLPTQSCSSM